MSNAKSTEELQQSLETLDLFLNERSVNEVKSFEAHRGILEMLDFFLLYPPRLVCRNSLGVLKLDAQSFRTIWSDRIDFFKNYQSGLH